MTDGRGTGRGGARGVARDKDPLSSAIETLVALETRVEGIEDAVTSGEALALPPAPRRRIRENVTASLQALEASLLVGTLVRRIHLRLGAIERALEHRAPLGLEVGVRLRSPRRLQALHDDRQVLRRSGTASSARHRAN